MIPPPDVAPSVLQALARLTEALRPVTGYQAMMLGLVLFEQATELYARGAVPETVIHGGNGAGGSQTVRDRWISQQEAADRLGISPRTLRRRAYRALIVGRGKVSEVALNEFMRCERERARR
jgi:hypothetical protein